MPGTAWAPVLDALAARDVEVTPGELSHMVTDIATEVVAARNADAFDTVPEMISAAAWRKIRLADAATDSISGGNVVHSLVSIDVEPIGVRLAEDGGELRLRVVYEVHQDGARTVVREMWLFSFELAAVRHALDTAQRCTTCGAPGRMAGRCRYCGSARTLFGEHSSPFVLERVAPA